MQQHELLSKGHYRIDAYHQFNAVSLLHASLRRVTYAEVEYHRKSSARRSSLDDAVVEL